MRTMMPTTTPTMVPGRDRSRVGVRPVWWTDSCCPRRSHRARVWRFRHRRYSPVRERGRGICEAVVSNFSGGYLSQPWRSWPPMPTRWCAAPCTSRAGLRSSDLSGHRWQDVLVGVQMDSVGDVVMMLVAVRWACPSSSSRRVSPAARNSAVNAASPWCRARGGATSQTRFG